jgi:2-C-methyl-D-erythritol 4-phosphate cytidylyltransferase
MRGQTPQAFRLSVIKEAHRLAEQEPGLEATDDCSLVLKYQLAKVYVMRGEEHNIKVTYAEDVFLADKIFQLKSETTPTGIDLCALDKKVVVIFGSSRGIGQEIGAIAEKHGAKVFGCSRQTGVDVSSYEQVEKALKTVYGSEKKINYVVDTAGKLTIKKIANRDYSDILSEIQTNYLGAIAVAKASIPFLKETKGAMLFFTSSSYTRGRAGFAAYSSAKAAIVNFVQAIAEEVYEDQIRINAINPERTATPMRSENFGTEPVEALLKASEVADFSLKTLLSNLTGQVIDVRKTILLESRILERKADEAF